jgi:CHAD domain-containing protein
MMAIRAKTPARPLRRSVRTAARPVRRKSERQVDGKAMMQRWAGHWLRTCRDMPKQALRLLDHAAPDPEKQIHAFRRLMKAWRALLKLAPKALASEARMVRSEVKGLRQSFGAVRDATVVAKALGKVLPEAAGEVEAPADVLEQSRQQFEAVRAKLAWLSTEMARWSVTGEGGSFLLTGFRRICRKARRRLDGDPRRMSMKRLHAWRTAIVDLGYQIDFFQPADPAGFKPKAEATERLRAHLGTVVDLNMARKHLSEAVPARRRRKAEREIEKSIAKKRAKAALIGDRLLEQRPKAMSSHLGTMLAAHEPRRVRFV